MTTVLEITPVFNTGSATVAHARVRVRGMVIEGVRILAPRGGRPHALFPHVKTADGGYAPLLTFDDRQEYIRFSTDVVRAWQAHESTRFRPV